MAAANARGVQLGNAKLPVADHHVFDHAPA
jgi:hypothetical protein